MSIAGPVISAFALIALLKSYEKTARKKCDRLLAPRGSARDLWAHQHADDFVKLRES
jgi:hypothetical protein